MTDRVIDRAPEPARDPQDLERLLLERQNAGDIDGMMILFECDAVVDGVQQPALVNGDLALTSTRSQSGSVTAEVARRQPDGTWRWVIDRYEIA